jgi:hypothetical protein
MATPTRHELRDLPFLNDYPAGDASQRLIDEMTFQRACQVMLWRCQHWWSSPSIDQRWPSALTSDRTLRQHRQDEHVLAIAPGVLGPGPVVGEVVLCQRR